MDRQPVASSTIVSVGYDEATALLEVEFRQGRVYHYFDVPRPHYEALLTASSPNGYLNDNVKPYFRCSRS